MSNYVYSDVKISAAQQRKLAEERKRREEEERRRREEAKRREMEELRRQEITEEQERLAVVKKFRDAMTEFTKKDKVTEKKKGSSISQPDDMHKMAQEIKAKLDAFPSSWHQPFRAELKQAQEVYQKVIDSDYDPYYYNSLKYKVRDLARLYATAESCLEERNRMSRKLKEMCHQLIIEMEIVEENSLLDSHRRQARTIIADLRVLFQEQSTGNVDERFHSLKGHAEQLKKEYNQVQEGNEVRCYLMQNASEVLESMGYQVVEIKRPADSETHPEALASSSLFFRTPQKGVLEMSFDHDSTLTAHYGLPKSEVGSAAESSEALHGCEQWCRDYDALQEELKAREIYLQTQVRLDTYKDGLQVIMVPEDFFAEDSQFLPHEEPGRRRES